MPAAYSSEIPSNTRVDARPEAPIESRHETLSAEHDSIPNGTRKEETADPSSDIPRTAHSEASAKISDNSSKTSPQLSSTSSPSSSHKKKKKRKNASNRELDESQPLPNEASIQGDGLEQWRARAINRRALLAHTNADNGRLMDDLSAAQARADDAEQAEAVVNRGLLTARSVIAQRDRAIADLTSVHQQLKAEHAVVMDEKKRAEKRLVILKTMSANLHEAREGREVAEKKVDELGLTNSRLMKEVGQVEEVNTGLVKDVERMREVNAKLVRETEQAKEVNTNLTKDVEGLKRQVDVLNTLKQQIVKAEIESDELRNSKEKLRVTAKRNSIRAAGLGAGVVFTLSLTMQMFRGEEK